MHSPLYKWKPQPIDPTPESVESLRIANLKTTILAHLAEALNESAQRVRRAAAGESVFHSDPDLKTALAVLRLAPSLLPLLPEPPYVPNTYPGLPEPIISICPICGKGPGAHWADQCPDRPPNEQYRFHHKIVPGEIRDAFDE